MKEYRLDIGETNYVFPTLQQAEDFNQQQLGGYGTITEVNLPPQVDVSYHTKESLHSETRVFLDKYYDVDGLLYLQRVRDIISTLIPANDIINDLATQMINSVERWRKYVWDYTFYMENRIVNNRENLPFNLEATVPVPCFFRDISWVLDGLPYVTLFNALPAHLRTIVLTNYRQLEPNRVVNTDVSFYTNIYS